MAKRLAPRKPTPIELETAIHDLANIAEVASAHFESLLSLNRNGVDDLLVRRSQVETAMFCVYHMEQMAKALRDRMYGGGDV